MRGVNSVTIIGRLGQDPDSRTTQSGSSVCSLSIATSEQWTDKQTGDKQERTEWHRVKLFGRLAEVAGQYLQKGAPVYVRGSLRTEKWTDKEGHERQQTVIIGDDLQMLGGKPEGQRSEPREAPRQRQAQRPAQHREPEPSGFDDGLGDLPF